MSSGHAKFLAKGARGGTRTRKPLRAMDFESIEYADFSTRAGAEKGSGMRSEAEVRLVLELVANGLRRNGRAG